MIGIPIILSSCYQNLTFTIFESLTFSLSKLEIIVAPSKAFFASNWYDSVLRLGVGMVGLPELFGIMLNPVTDSNHPYPIIRNN